MRSQYQSEVGGYLRYHDFPGGGPVRVFLHGLGAASSADFPAIAADPLLAGQRSLLIDCFGFGLSDRPEQFGYTIEEHAESVARLLHNLGIDSIQLIGHSMGGAIAITLAALHPELAAQLVILEGNLDPGGGDFSGGIATHDEASFLATGYAESLAQVAAWAKQTPALATFLGTVRAAAPHALYRSARSLVAGTTPTMRERFVALPIPRAYVFGERSLPDPDYEWLAEHGITVATIPNAGHAMMDDNPDGCIRVLADLLGQRPRTNS